MNETVMTDTTFTVTTPVGGTSYFYAETMAEAFLEALEEYGEGITIRPAWYGEWECGSEESGSCWYDKFGVHHRRGE